MFKTVQQSTDRRKTVFDTGLGHIKGKEKQKLGP